MTNSSNPVVPEIVSEMVDNYLQCRLNDLRGMSAADIAEMIRTINPDEDRADEMAAATVAWLAEN